MATTVRSRSVPVDGSLRRGDHRNGHRLPLAGPDPRLSRTAHHWLKSRAIAGHPSHSRISNRRPGSVTGDPSARWRGPAIWPPAPGPGRQPHRQGHRSPHPVMDSADPGPSSSGSLKWGELPHAPSVVRTIPRGVSCSGKTRVLAQAAAAIADERAAAVTLTGTGRPLHLCVPASNARRLHLCLVAVVPSWTGPDCDAGDPSEVPALP